MLSKSDPDHGTVISADFQSGGKGRFQRQWESAAGKNLLLSVILYPRGLDPSRLFVLNMLSSLAIRDVLTESGIGPIRIKWPNDVLVDRKKIAGILVYNKIEGAKLGASVLSIGLNINQVSFEGIGTVATSLKLAAQREFSVERLMDRLLLCLDRRYRQAGRDQERLRSEYLEHLLGTRESVRCRAPGLDHRGHIHDVLADGRLVMRNPEGVWTLPNHSITIDYEE